MANYSQISSKKLNNLLENGNITDEQRKEIQEVLEKRNSISKGPAEAPAPAEAHTEASEASTEEPAETAEASTKPTGKFKMADEERDQLVEKLKAEAVNHRCMVVPFNSLEWVPGTIVNIITEKRNNNVLFTVKTDDNRRIVKGYNSQLIKVLDEVVEPEKKVRQKKTAKLDENGNPIEVAEEWTDEAIEEAVKEVIANVGKTISFPEAGAYGEIKEGAKDIEGRIISLVPNKRARTILYRIEYLAEDENGTQIKKYAHKVATSASLKIAEELDEVGSKINEGFVTRRYKEPTQKVVLSPEEAMKAAELALNKAKETLEKAKETLEKRQATYDAAKQAYEESNKASNEENTASNEDLM